MRSLQRCGKYDVSTREKIVNASIHEAISSTQWRCFFGGTVSTRWPSNKSCGSDSERSKLAAKSSDKSTYLPATIWFTNFGGTGEKPGPTTNSLSASTWTALPALWVTLREAPADKLLAEQADDEAVVNRGEANVETNDGTTKGRGLPCVDTVPDWKPAPEFTNAEVWPPSDLGMPPKAACDAADETAAASTLVSTAWAGRAANRAWMAAWTVCATKN